MKRQRNMTQMKEQIKTAEKELNKMEISNLSDVEFKLLVIRMLQELTGYFNSMKKTQAIMKVALCEIKKIYREPTVMGGSRDSNQRFGSEGRKKHPTRTE